MKQTAVLAGVTLALCACALGQPLRQTRERPNFILLLSDDQSWDGLSVPMIAGQSASRSRYVQTPSIARLAEEGMRFSNAYAPSPVCSPTRVSLQTGKSPAQLHWTKASPNIVPGTGYRLIPPRLVRHIQQAETTIAETLRHAGYSSAHFGKWHLGGGGPSEHGYDVSDGDTSNRDAAPFKHPNPVDIVGMGTRAAAFMKKMVAEKKPFYLQMSYHALHYPENASPATVAKYRSKMPGRNEKAILQAAMAEHLDSGVGALMQVVEDLGLRDNTYVIYMSDNGGGGGKGRDRMLQGGKGSLWEGGIRVPMIVRGPGVPPGESCHTPVVGWDLFPTFCELAGIVSLPEDVEGGSLGPLLSHPETGRVQRPREELVWHFPHYQGSDGPHFAIRLGDHKLIRFYESGRSRLFDLSRDPGEAADLSGRLPEKARELSRLLDGYLRNARAQMPTPNPHYDPNVAPKPKQRRSGARGKGRRAK